MALKIKNSILSISGFLLVALLGCSKNSDSLVKDFPPVTEISGVVIESASDITLNSATVTAHLKDDGGGKIIRKGICWSENHDATIGDSHADNDPTISSGWIFASKLIDLEPNTVYYARAYAENEKGIIYSDNELSFTTKSDWVVYVDSSSFDDVSSLESHWNYLYPWGSDHNGSARMYKEQISVNSGILTLSAVRVDPTEGNSTADPYPQIHYHSGAIHLKQMITVTDAEPTWVISGDFQAPTVSGSWPAFWITGVDNWPPESDILEFKGDAMNWQNTMTGPDWQDVTYQTEKTEVADATSSWHSYKIVMNKTSSENLNVTYFIDDVQTAVHVANFMNQRFWLIINLQMEGSSGSSGPSGTTIFKAKNIYVAAQPS